METYTFSRALHLMRYGGKNMKCIEDDTNFFYCVRDLRLCIGHVCSDELLYANAVDAEEIMGEWVEVK